jgi:alanine transaminase
MSTTTSSPAAPRLNTDNINPHVVKAQYAVRGELAVKSELYRAKIASGDAADLPFKEVISANIGNPQQLDQKPITFFRQVASLLENPKLLEHPDVLVDALGYKTDVIERAKWLLSQCQSVGAYSASAGVPAIKKSVADFLESESFLRNGESENFLCLPLPLLPPLSVLRHFPALGAPPLSLPLPSSLRRPVRPSVRDEVSSHNAQRLV